jgi:hypothetical protein
LLLWKRVKLQFRNTLASTRRGDERKTKVMTLMMKPIPKGACNCHFEFECIVLVAKVIYRIILNVYGYNVGWLDSLSGMLDFEFFKFNFNYALPYQKSS